MKTTKEMNKTGARGRITRRTRMPALQSVGLALSIAAGFSWLASCSPSADVYSVPTSAFAPQPKATLSVGDMVRFTYPGAIELNQSLKIQPDGKVSLPMIGSVSASGRSPSSLQASLTEMYKSRLNDPTVYVSLEQPSATVYVSGEVMNPGKVALDRPITALEGVMEVGGFSKFANPKKVYVIRTEKGQQKRFVLNLGSPLGGFETQAFYLRPYDVVYVDKSVW